MPIPPPLHPGELLREDVLPALNLGVSEAAAKLGVSRAMLSSILNQRAGLSAEMCVRIENLIGRDNGGKAEMWQRIQASYDLHQARKSLAARSGGQGF